MIRAALELLGQNGFSGVTVKQVAEKSATSKRSVQQSFPGGNIELVHVALEEVEQDLGRWLRRAFDKPASIPEKVQALFIDAADNLEESGFTRGCPVASVILDVDRDAQKLHSECGAVFNAWQDTIAAGLTELPEPERREVAALILAALEGALVISRAQATKHSLLDTGKTLAAVLARRLQAAKPRRRAKAKATRTTRRRSAR